MRNTNKLSLLAKPITLLYPGLDLRCLHMRVQSEVVVRIVYIFPRVTQDYINQMLIPYGCQIDVNQAEIFAMGITIDTVAARSTPFTLLAWERGPDGEPWVC